MARENTKRRKLLELAQSLRERTHKLEERTGERVKAISGSGRKPGSSPWIVGFSCRLRAVADALQGPPSRTIERLAIGTVLLVAALFTGFNMFRFPNYEPDEGTYIGSA
jgi:hypothetical protein